MIQFIYLVVVYKLGVLAHPPPPGLILDLRVLAHFGSKKSYKKMDKTDKDFQLYQVFVYNFLSQNMLIFPRYILFTKTIETFWSRDVTSIRGIS